MNAAEYAHNTARLAERLAREATNETDAAAHIAAMKRYDKAAEQLARGVTVTAEINDGYYIPSRSGGDVYYTTATSCTCDAGLKGKACWHTAMAEAMQRAMECAAIAEAGLEI